MCIHFATDELMEKSSKVKFSSSVQLLPWRPISFSRPNLIYRLSEDAAYTQKSLGDNGSLGTQKNMEGTNFHLNEFQTVARGEGRNCFINHSEAKRRGNSEASATGFMWYWIHSRYRVFIRATQYSM